MARRGRWPAVTAALAVAALAAGVTPLRAQHGAGLDQLNPQFPERGGIVIPYFDGWWANPDGSHTYSFGYMNRNTAEIVEIPLGPGNRIEPAIFDGPQPTHFPPARYGGYSGRRERGVFTVTVPSGFQGDVVWTLTHAGETHSIPARTISTTYELSYEPMGSGSLPPSLRFDPSGPEVSGRVGLTAKPLTISVGRPLQLNVWAADRGEREESYPVTMTWQKHQGPGTVEFSPRTARLDPAAGEGGTSVTFDAPGDYLLRVRIDNFSARDSNFGFQCCWTNGYVPVTVRP